MKRSAALAVVAGLFVWTSSAQAQETFTIKLKERGQGEVILITKSETVTSKVKVEDGKGNVLLDKAENKVEVSAYKETVLKRERLKRATKLEREYSKFQTKVGDAAEDSPLQGKTVVIERDGEQYTFTYKGGEAVTGPAAAKLMKEFARKGGLNTELEKLMLPKNAVKVGESWMLDTEPIFKNLFEGADEMAFDTAKATGSGKLVKAYMKGGRQFGEMRYRIAVPLKSMGKVPMQMIFNDGAKMTMDLTLDTCIDGSSEAGVIQVRVMLNGVAMAGDSTVRLDVVSVTTGTQAEPAKR